MSSQAASDDLVGRVIEDRYRILSLRGAGGFGAVYEVEHVLVGRRLALKTLHGEAAQNANVVARFYREARAAAAIGDDHIVEVSDMGHLPSGAPYIVMELLEGKDLGAVLEAEGPLPVSRVAHIALQCCHALGLAHERGIVHRDIKPDNIFIAPRPHDPDFVKLLDFGISKVHEAAPGFDPAISAMKSTGTLIGTPLYMAPEQLEDGEIDGRTDLYALGCAVYQMLTGRVPFQASSYGALALKILHDPPEPVASLRADVPLELSKVVDKALAKRPADRFEDAEAMAKALRPFAPRRKGRRRETAPSSRPPAGVSGNPAGASGPDVPWTSMPPLPMSRTRRWLGLGALLLLSGAVAWVRCAHG